MDIMSFLFVLQVKDNYRTANAQLFGENLGVMVALIGPVAAADVHHGGRK